MVWQLLKVPMLATKTLKPFKSFLRTFYLLDYCSCWWNGFIAFCVIYWLIKRIMEYFSYSSFMVWWVFCIIFYVVPIYLIGYDFISRKCVNNLNLIKPFFWIRSLLLLLLLKEDLWLEGIFMIYNIYNTIK